MQRVLMGVFSVLMLAGFSGCQSTPERANSVASAMATVVKIKIGDEGLCSGVIIDARRGLVVSNRHCVSIDDKMVYEVELHDGRTGTATVVGTSKVRDIAVFRISIVEGLREAVIATEPLRAGDWVFAIGHPHGLHWSVSLGIVSYVKRNIPDWGDYMQIDTAVNPGNSGGGLFNERGELVGIPSMGRVAFGGAQIGLNFAISVEDALASVAEVLA